MSLLLTLNIFHTLFLLLTLNIELPAGLAAKDFLSYQKPDFWVWENLTVSYTFWKLKELFSSNSERNQHIIYTTTHFIKIILPLFDSKIIYLSTTKPMLKISHNLNDLKQAFADVLQKYLFLKFLQYSQENTCVGVSF